MKTRIELDKDDMKKIIAEHFSVSEDRATVGAKGNVRWIWNDGA